MHRETRTASGSCGMVKIFRTFSHAVRLDQLASCPLFTRCLPAGNYNSAGQYLQFANSSDGIRWSKPDLGRYTLTGK